MFCFLHHRPLVAIGRLFQRQNRPLVGLRCATGGGHRSESEGCVHGNRWVWLVYDACWSCHCHCVTRWSELTIACWTTFGYTCTNTNAFSARCTSEHGSTTAVTQDKRMCPWTFRRCLIYPIGEHEDCKPTPG